MIDTPLEPIIRLSRDIRAAAATLTDRDARYAVDTYYAIQDFRIQAFGQSRAAEEAQEPHQLASYLAEQLKTLEEQMKLALAGYATSREVGRWALDQKGIGPVIAAGLLAHIDIRRAPTVGHIWSFAGLNPERKWEKKTKRPWNAKLKVLTWKMGESFVKVSGADDAFYGKIYVERKALELARNEAGAFAEQAKAILAAKNFRDETKAKEFYAAGKLPPAHIHARAKRYAVKLFLSHYHYVEYLTTFGEPPPKPYILTPAGGHAHFIAPPGYSA